MPSVFSNNFWKVQGSIIFKVLEEPVKKQTNIQKVEKVKAFNIHLVKDTYEHVV